MSLICTKCRRLVRQAQLDLELLKYHCNNCQKTYPIPQRYFQKDELNIPQLASNTALKVTKAEDYLSIVLPVNVFTLTFMVKLFILLFSTFFGFFLVAISKDANPYHIFILFAFFFGILLANSLSRKVLEIKEGYIYWIKKVFIFSLKRKVNLNEIKRIREIEVESAKGSNLIISRFVEIEFKEMENWEIGHKLSKEDREYLIAELKWFHFNQKVSH